MKPAKSHKEPRQNLANKKKGQIRVDDDYIIDAQPKRVHQHLEQLGAQNIWNNQTKQPYSDRSCRDKFIIDEYEPSQQPTEEQQLLDKYQSKINEVIQKEAILHPAANLISSGPQQPLISNMLSEAYQVSPAKMNGSTTMQLPYQQPIHPFLQPKPIIPLQPTIQQIQVPQELNSTNSNSLIMTMLNTYSKLKVKEAIYNQNIRDIYKSLMLNKRMERQQGNSAYLISQMFFDTFMPILDLMRNNPQQSDQLACLFVEEHLDFLVTAKKGLVRKQVQNDKLICAFAILVKLMKAQRVEGRKIFNNMIIILTHKVSVLFVKDLITNPLDLIQDQKYFGEIFYSQQLIPLEPPIPDDSNMRYLSMLRKLSMLLWGLLWLDPNIFITEDMQKNFEENGRTLSKYSKIDLDKDRSIFFKYVSAFVTCAKHKPNFTHVPALSSLWDILSYAIYKSQRLQISQEDNEARKVLLKQIFIKCQAVINIPHTEVIQLNGEVINNSSSCLKQVKINYPQIPNHVIKNIHNELFVCSFFNQRGQIEILKTKEGIITGRINDRNEDYNDYDFYKILFEADQRQEYYT